MKEFLSQKGIPFIERNVREDPSAFEELQRLGYQSVPVTIIDGEIIVGFNRKKLEEALSR